MSLTSLHYIQPVFKVHRQNHGVCIYVTIRSAHSRCADGMQSRCCCNYGRMRSWIPGKWLEN